MRGRQRIERIEAEMRRRQPMHNRVVVQIPWDADTDAYLGALPCVCGAASCELQTFGLIVPQPLTSEAWQQQAKAYADERRALDA